MGSEAREAYVPPAPGPGRRPVRGRPVVSGVPSLRPRPFTQIRLRAATTALNLTSGLVQKSPAPRARGSAAGGRRAPAWPARSRINSRQGLQREARGLQPCRHTQTTVHPQGFSRGVKLMH
jgi:hypothetical protein